MFVRPGGKTVLIAIWRKGIKEREKKESILFLFQCLRTLWEGLGVPESNEFMYQDHWFKPHWDLGFAQWAAGREWGKPVLPMEKEDQLWPAWKEMGELVLIPFSAFHNYGCLTFLRHLWAWTCFTDLSLYQHICKELSVIELLIQVGTCTRPRSPTSLWKHMFAVKRSDKKANPYRRQCRFTARKRHMFSSSQKPVKWNNFKLNRKIRPPVKVKDACHAYSPVTVLMGSTTCIFTALCSFIPICILPWWGDSLATLCKNGWSSLIHMLPALKWEIPDWACHPLSLCMSSTDSGAQKPSSCLVLGLLSDHVLPEMAQTCISTSCPRSAPVRF